MLMCKKCYTENFEEMLFDREVYGACEMCGKVGIGIDIPCKFLEKKKKKVKVKSEKDWLIEQIGYCNCFISIPKNKKEHKEIAKCYLKAFEKRLKEVNKDE